MTVGVQKSGNKIQYCRNRKGCHPLREFPYDDANITLYFGIKAIRRIFNAQKPATESVAVVVFEVVVVDV